MAEVELGDLPQVKAWTADLGVFDLRVFLMSNVSVTEACSLMTLISPEFLEYRGGVFLKFMYAPEGVDHWMDHLNGDRRAVEVVMNHVHLWDFLAPKGDSEHEALVWFGRQVTHFWEVVLKSRFADREFVVEFDDGTNEYGPTLTLHSV
ncbi:hypothetical protein ACFCV3_19580 [Kribbella sp. NPDC056345]|uniref:hypothetical protein n=1 Tax=Kribbella sp. NPDC056345 TaxID=3345789 RepID=UPI0035DD9143